ncbi:DUF4124 domain-containing protein [Arenimonas sp.]|uniref:DUF4124 domain-containing protein n=1 Tax=Arenimonas sp. TaxID=1872635 RepID=UPI0035AE19E0
MNKPHRGDCAPSASALLVLAVLFAPPALAQQVYKCSDGKGAATYQQVPCAEASQEQAVREYAREPAPPPTQEATITPAPDGHYPGLGTAEQDARVAKRERRSPLNRSRTPEQKKQDEEIRAAQRYDDCQEARDEQKKQLARIGRSVSAMRAAEAKVSRACR